tara:strand:+ start:418 stop:696 length:279 start_codon:yes stop_codon:yes gene_type:complete
MIYTTGNIDFKVQYTQSKRGGKTTRELFAITLGEPQRKDGTTVRKIGMTLCGPKVNIIKAGKGSQWKIEGYKGIYTWKVAWDYGVRILASKL